MRSEAASNRHGWRILVVAAVLVGLFGMLVLRLVQLQVGASQHGAEFLKRQGDLRAVRAAEIPAFRGQITDRRGTPLAVSTPVVTLWLNPQEFQDPDAALRLALALDINVQDLQSRLHRYRNKQFMYLARHLTPERARAVLQLGLKGVYGDREYRRFYPAGEVVSQLVGTTDVDGAGVSGVELAFDELLRGEVGRKKFIKDLHGDVIRDIGVVKAAQPGESLALSIDLRLQHVQHRELLRAVNETGAKSGSAITLDAHSGEVLAITTVPSFNPNRRGSVDLGAMRNRVVTDVFEPGSIVKPLTLVAALESGEYSVDSVIDTSPGRIRVGDKVLPDPRNYGELSVSQVIEKSSQVGVTKMAQHIGHESILEVFERFGLGRVTGAEFPGEGSGRLPDHDFWSEIDQVTPAFGYGLLATPLQMAHAYSVFANDGRLSPLTIIAIPSSDASSRRIIESDLADRVVEVLHRTTGMGGTAFRAAVPGYQVGGKTGTVHKVGEGGYLDDRYVALFAGIAPAQAPRYVTVVVIDEPSGDLYGGGSAAAPVYSRITREVLRLHHAMPTEAYAGQDEREVADGSA